MIPISVLDLAPIVEGGDVRQSLLRARDLAQQAERWGYRRFWVAEHHNMPGIASAATSVVIAHVAAGTSRIRVGAGGIMLPNHAPLVIAEQFGTLAALHPGRIDLGLGRAPGTDHATARALRRTLHNGEGFPQDVLELMHYFDDARLEKPVRAIPGAGYDGEVWLLGSSLFGAQLAGTLGLPYAFASHFAPALLMQALATYRQAFQPSRRLAKPHVMVATNIVAADTDEAAQELFTSVEQAVVGLRHGRRSELPPPRPGFRETLQASDLVMLDEFLGCSFVGSSQTILPRLQALVHATGADELIVSAQLFDHAARLRSYELAAELAAQLRVLAGDEKERGGSHMGSASAFLA